MRVVSLLFFIFNLPVVVFLASLLYGGFSPQILKEELSQTKVYERLLSSPNKEVSDNLILTALAKRVTPSYLQNKIEDAIDDSYAWVTGTTKEPPLLSFKDLKEDIIANDPELSKLTSEFKELPKTQEAYESYPPQRETEINFVKNDFSFPLKDSLADIKQTHTVLSIILPVLIVLLILCLISLIVLNHSARSRFRWLGSAFLLGGIFGYLTLLLSQYVSHVFLRIFSQAEDPVIHMAYPIVEGTLTAFINHYARSQVTATAIFLVLGITSLLFALVLQSPAPALPIKKIKGVRKSS
jgi:hypothetical protein